MTEINKKERDMTGHRFGRGGYVGEVWAGAAASGGVQSGHDPGPREEGA